MKTYYKYQQVRDLKIFYREAGNPLKETIVLLHGFPTSSHMYRQVLAELSDEYYLIAPDYPGFGESDFPTTEEFTYSFDNIAKVMDEFLENLNITSYTLMIQDYGAPIGFRIATAHPERVKALIIQNGNAYEEGLGIPFVEIRKFWENRNPETEAAALGMLSFESTKFQYIQGTKNPEAINPDNWNLDYYKLSRPGNDSAQLELSYDYRNNLKLYPQWQKYLREQQPPILITWGKNDLFFPEAGAESYLKDGKVLDYHIYDTGHFALEEEGDAIIKNIRNFMQQLS